MKSKILNYILLTTVLAGCGGSGSSSNSTASGNSGPAWNSNNSSGSNGSGSSTEITPQLPQGLAPEFKKFLEANNLQKDYIQLMTLHETTVDMVDKYNPETDKDKSTAKDICGKYLEMFRVYVRIETPLLQQRTEELKTASFPELDFKFDADESWTNLKMAAKKIAYYPRELVDSLLSGYSKYTPDSILEQILMVMKNLDANDKLKEDFVTRLDEMKEEMQKVSKEYDNTLYTTQPGSKDSPSQKLRSIENNLEAATAKRVAKILTGNYEEPTHTSTWSNRGTEIFQGLESNINLIATSLIGTDEDKQITYKWHAILGAITRDFLNPYYSLTAHNRNSSYESNRDKRYRDFLFKPSYLLNKMQYFNRESMSPELSGTLSKLDASSDEMVRIKRSYSAEYAEDSAFMNAVYQDLEKRIVDYLKTVDEFKGLFEPLPTAAGMSAEVPAELSRDVSHRQARTAENGSLNLRGFNVNGAAGESIALGMPLFVQLKGDVSSSKSTEAATGSVAYRLGNTVIGAIQGYANSGEGFGVEGRQLETSIIASHSFGAFFIEGQIGTVSATDVHDSNWKGMRSQVTLGIDTEFVSPFVQVAHRQLDRSGIDLNQTTAYVGVDMDVAKLKADSYTVDTRLFAKVGYGDKAWSKGTNDLGTTSEFSGSVEWSGTLSLNCGISFNASLNLDTTSKASASLQFSVEQ